MPQVKVRNDEPFDVILRRFRRSCEKAGIFTEMRRREFYEKPTSVRKRKAAAADDDVLNVVTKQIKQSQDAVKQFIEGDRQDLADKEQIHIDHLKVYLPEQLSEDEINTLISDAMEQTGASEMKDMGKVMGILKPKLQGRADMGAVSGLIKQKLQG